MWVKFPHTVNQWCLKTLVFGSNAKSWTKAWLLCLGRIVSKTDDAMHFACLGKLASVELVSDRYVFGAYMVHHPIDAGLALPELVKGLPRVHSDLVAFNIHRPCQIWSGLDWPFGFLASWVHMSCRDWWLIPGYLVSSGQTTHRSRETPTPHWVPCRSAILCYTKFGQIKVQIKIIIKARLWNCIILNKQ